MAFVRRHRLVLVPLFAALMVGVGIVFLLRSGSEEPANDLAADAVFKAPVWEEVVELRDDHTRVYNVTHEVEYEDPVTGEKCTDTIVSKVREVGSGLCCRDGAGQWVPTIAEWETGGLGFRMKRGSWQIEVPMTLGGAYDYTVGGKTLAMRPTWILLSDGTNTVSLGSIDASVVGVINERDPSKLVFADALGAKSGVDIEFVLEPGALHQNVVLRAKPTLPEGFDAEDARLYVYTELGLDAYTAGDAVDVTIARAGVDVSAADLVTSRNTTDPIVFTVDEIIDGEPRETILHAFAESRVWDATGSANETRAARQLWRNPADSKTYLVESVPYSYVAEATGAVTLDYQNVNASITADEIWTANITYYVTANVTVSGGTAEDPVTLTIEPGTVVKFAAGKSLTIGEHGAIVAKGEPYSCIVFTSDQDDNSGEDLTSGFTGDPDAGDYGTAINIGVNASADCAIEFCKTGYASKGIDARRDFGAIRHCIVRDCTRGVYLYGSSRPDVFNNLVADCGTGVEFAGVGAGNCLVINNTIDGGYNSIFFGDTGGSATMTIHNNLLYNYSYAGLRRLGGGYSIYTSNNATMPFFYDEYQLPMAPYPYIGAGLGLQNNVYLTISPYDTTNTQLGAYFIDTGSTPGGGQLVNAGTGSPYDDPSAFSIEPPEVVGSDIDESDTWSKRSGDTGAVDIGYHHPRVDKVISNAVRKIGCTGSAVTLEIEPGVVVAFNGSETRLQFDPDATATPTLLCDGLPAEPIVLAGKPLVSMWVEAQYIDSSWSYPKAGVLLNDPTDEYTDAIASITYTRVIGLDDGIDIRKDSVNEIRHCTFERGEAGLYGTGSDIDIAVSNCLMRDNRRGAIFKLNHAASSVELRNCTFDANGMGAVFQECNTAGLTILDCLFSNAEEGIRLWEDPDEYGSWTHDHNAFWNCGEDNTKKIWLYYEDPQVQGDIGDNSIALDADPYDPAWFDDEDPASADWAAQWYLDQDGECIDAGSRSAVTAGLSVFTTRYDDNDYDYGAVDIGYHYATVLRLNKTHFDNGAAGDAGEIDISYDYGGNVTYRTISIYNSSGELVYQTTEASSASTISITWNGQGNQTGYSGDLDTGAYTVVITGGAGNDEYTRFRVYIEQSADAALEITRPTSNSTVDWY